MSFKQRYDNQWRSIALSFVVGAASMSLCMYARERRIRRRQIQYETETEESSTPPSFGRTDSSFLDNVYQSVEDAVEDIKSRIGELPSTTRGHWPWETIRRDSNSRRKKSDKPEPDPTMRLTPDRLQPVRENPELCIGSIFGLDVGGTLAKLCYFEQQSDHDVIGIRNVRERNYHQAASAQAVLKARRGHDLEEKNGGNKFAVTSHETLRDLSFSPGVLRKRLSTASSQALHQQGKGNSSIDEEKLANDSGHNTARNGMRNIDVHSSSSDDDLARLYDVRQESMPDDLNAYATTVHHNENGVPSHDKQNGSDEKIAGMGMKKSRSMFDLSMSQKNRDHAEALDRFYHFARKLDTYREGVKDTKLSFYSRALGGEFHFIQFETRRMENAMELIRANDLHLTIREMGATGGGAHKFANDWDQKLGIQMKKKEELDSLVAGMQFVISTVVGECYTFRPKRASETGCGKTDRAPKKSINRSFESTSTTASFAEEEKSSPGVGPFASDESDSEEIEDNDCQQGTANDEWWWSRKVQRDSISYSSTYPYLLVTIGTGVSILRVDGPRKHERISGSTIGGGTYWGLIRLLTDLESFEDVMRLAEHGDPTKVDMMVGDIYGNNKEALEKLGLPASLVASSFGKLVARENPADGLKQEDLARALLLMVTNNIGQVAYLNSKLHKTSRIYFVGNFLRGNKLSQRRLSFAINYWSKGEMEALFLEHEGYFGALGAFLLSQDIPVQELERPPMNRHQSQHGNAGIRVGASIRGGAGVRGGTGSRGFRRRKSSARSQTVEEHQVMF